jgi:8-oxo-dGTP pyrophosphatase MutT (NUDIX family)/GNAT superfamily N-acetyltransferase
VLALAPRLAEGVSPWRDPTAVREAVVGWVEASLAHAAERGRFVLVAKVDAEVAGFVAAEEKRHWTGDLDLYVGELVVSEDHAGTGVGRCLIEAVTALAANRGIHRITLETGAANHPARAFYQCLGFEPEDVRLTRQTSNPPPDSLGRRTEYYYDPAAPEPNRLIPACNLLVVDNSGRVLLQRRRDTGQWALPGGAQDLGETPSQCAARECEEETGITAEVDGLLGIFSDPQHIVRYADGETRQQFEITLIGRPVAGVPTSNDEASEVGWFTFAEIERLDVHPSMRRQLRLFQDGVRLHVD